MRWQETNRAARGQVENFVKCGVIMALNSGISWTDHSWNPWQGCRKVSPGCLHCYMYRDKHRFGHDPETVVRSKPATFAAPLKWKEPAKVFVCSWSDFFIEDADAWRDEAWEIMRRTPHLTYMLLTKRAENIKDRLPPDWPMKNVWLGVTAENQETANKRIPLLLDIPAVCRFVSVEPMISPVSLSAWMWESYEYRDRLNGYLSGDDGDVCVVSSCRPSGKIGWIICGGESGPEARAMSTEWALDLKRQCTRTRTPFFMKQMSGKAPIPDFLQGQKFPRSI